MQDRDCKGTIYYRKKTTVVLARTDLGHVVMFAQLGEVSVEFFDALFVSLKQFGPGGGGGGEL